MHRAFDLEGVAVVEQSDSGSGEGPDVRLSALALTALADPLWLDLLCILRVSGREIW